MPYQFNIFLCKYIHGSGSQTLASQSGQSSGTVTGAALSISTFPCQYNSTNAPYCHSCTTDATHS